MSACRFFQHTGSPQGILAASTFSIRSNRAPFDLSLILTGYRFLLDRERRVHLLSGKDFGASGHGVFRAKEEGESNHVPPLVPPYRDADGLMGRHQVLSRRTRHFYRYVRSLLCGLRLLNTNVATSSSIQ